MKKTLIRQASRLALLAALSSLGWTSPAQAANDSAPKVLSGEVTRLRGQIVSRSRPAELGLPAGGRIVFRETTDASVLTDSQALMLLPGKKTPTYSVILRRGLIDIDVPDENPARVAVAVGTPGETRVVTLTGRSSVKVEGRNVVAIARSGLTTVSQGTRLVRLPPGVKRVYQSQGTTVDRPQIDATRWVGGRRVWIAASGAKIPVSGYVWSPIPGAAAYVVSLSDVTARRTLSTMRVSSPMVESLSTPLTPGRYELSVAGIDGDGFVSDKQTKLPISVVGVDLPGGAEMLPRDTILLAPEQQLHLTNAEGLTLTTAAHKTGVPGTEPFGLEGLERAAILIHPAGGGDSATLTLMRRQPLVSAWVGPKLATWPDDPVQLQVSFLDDRGNPTPETVQPTVRVLVGVDPIDVEWDKQGTLWQARLPAMKGRGPWVVRLEVVDQHGVIIGRDFAEISKTHRAPRISDFDPNVLTMAPGYAH